MPTNSKKKQSWFKRQIAAQKIRTEKFLARRPHRSFRLTRRRDAVRELELPGNIAFTGEVSRVGAQSGIAASLCEQVFDPGPAGGSGAS